MKKTLVVIMSFLFFTIGICCVNEANRNSIPTASSKYSRIIILDPGHGGEDGGAVAEDSTNEKEINLEIANRISCFFDLFGIEYIQTRIDDKALCDDGLDTVRKRKVSDITNRYNLINSVENSILLSIHQNFFSQKQYYGTQVFYSDKVKDSAVLAQLIQDNVKSALQPDNSRQIKASGDSVFLLDKAKTTSVMVECGFISNDNELNKLKNSTYQTQLGYYIFKGALEFLTEEKDV